MIMCTRVQRMDAGELPRTAVCLQKQTAAAAAASAAASMPVATRERPAREGGARENPSLRCRASSTIPHHTHTRDTPPSQAKVDAVSQKSPAHMHGTAASGAQVESGNELAQGYGR